MCAAVVLYLLIRLYAQLHNKVLAGPYTTGCFIHNLIPRLPQGYNISGHLHRQRGQRPVRAQS